ncbi:hypothetical protein FOXG_13260 [Fusarium oxysporum f. sp. lycopersici 4287]|uniref:Uncharacterized protein n=2 Tax=Fusarium oxysporum TaxID=5507 RepID=A0A0J9VTS5_FUSO4|nr:hypothetical protein FOXG_13260 [Fusarium oxysporum f. sp. lycopersici 4287]KNB14394.1 hypothetical protein FOXG_13260 [Fusarium oxysporum f. sp. lycopersici 4287]
MGTELFTSWTIKSMYDQTGFGGSPRPSYQW